MHVRRALLLEAGHRCAIPTCRRETTVFAHIVPWRSNKVHEYANLIVLCPTCHVRFDKGEIDRKSMLAYKAALSGRGSQRLAILDTFHHLHATVGLWESSIRAIETADVSEADEEQRHILVVECARAANRTWAAAQALAGLASVEIAELAHRLFSDMKHWADDVVDGLWPSMHPGARSHYDDGVEVLAALRILVCDGLGITVEHLKVIASPQFEPVQLGGSGKRF